MEKEIIHIEHVLLTNLFRLHLIQPARHTHDFSIDFIAPTSPFLKCRSNGLPAISDQVIIGQSTRNFVPDGVCSIFSKNENKRLLFFLESDRASESMSGTTDSAKLKTKLENYHQYLSCGGYKRYEKKWDYLLTGFRLLILCDSNMRKRQLTQFIPDEHLVVTSYKHPTFCKKVKILVITVKNSWSTVVGFYLPILFLIVFVSKFI